MSDQAGPSQTPHQSFLDDQSNSFELITKQFQEHKIDIYGTYEEPLFVAKQIGKILGIQNVRQVIKDFPEDYKVVFQIYTRGGLQKVQGLKEFGLYELVSISRKPFAKDFRKWSYTIFKEIRLTGEYRKKQQNDQLQLQNQQLIQEVQKYKQERDNYVITFEKEPCQKHLYIFRQGNEERNIYYIGQSIGVYRRLNTHKNYNCDGLKDVHKIPCINDKLCEKIIHCMLERQKYHHENDTLSPSSFYRCDLEYILLLSKYVCNTINTLFQCRQSIQENELINKLSQEFQQTHIIVQDDCTELTQFNDLSQQNSSESIQQNCSVQSNDTYQNSYISFDEWANNNLVYQLGFFIIPEQIRQLYNNCAKDSYINTSKGIVKKLDQYFKNNIQNFPNVIQKRNPMPQPLIPQFGQRPNTFHNVRLKQPSD